MLAVNNPLVKTRTSSFRRNSKSVSTPNVMLKLTKGCPTYSTMDFISKHLPFVTAVSYNLPDIMMYDDIENVTAAKLYNTSSHIMLCTVNEEAGYDKQVGHNVQDSDAEKHIWIVKWNLLADLHHDKHDDEVGNCRIHFFRVLSTLLYRRRVQLFSRCRRGGEHRSPRKKNFAPA